MLIFLFSLVKLLNKILIKFYLELFFVLFYIIKTIKDYLNPIIDRNNKVIFKYNNKKGGVYMFTNKVNNKRYVGSATDLNRRISRYFQKWYLNRDKSKNILIIRAIKKYGIENFYISILEYINTSSFELIKWEQYWIDFIKPEYNILKIAGNSLGFKHTKENKLNISKAKLGKKLNLEIRNRMSTSLKMSELVGHKHTLETKLKLSKIARSRKFDPHKGLFISVEDVSTGKVKIYKSIRQAAVGLKAATISIRSRVPNYKGDMIKPRNPIKSILFINKYKITLITSSPFSLKKRRKIIFLKNFIKN